MNVGVTEIRGKKRRKRINMERKNENEKWKIERVVGEKIEKREKLKNK